MESKTGSEFDRGKAAEEALDLILAGTDVDEALFEAGLPSRPVYVLPTRSPTANPKKIRKYVTRLVRSLVPWDFSGMPIHIGMQSELPSNFHAVRRCYGFVSLSLDQMLKPHLGARYEGRGPAIFLADVVIENDIWKRRVFGQRAIATLFDTLVTITIHEVAHLLQWTQPFCGGYVPENIGELTESTMTWIDSAEAKEHEDRVPHYGHEWDFIRNCVHLNYRAACGGVRVISDELAAGEQYGLSTFTDYRRALGDEPKLMIEASFSEIRELSPPEAFMDLWDEDMLDYQKRVRDSKQKETTGA